jgi:hypothetical protein
VFLSSGFTTSAIEAFIKSAKQTLEGQDAAYVLVASDDSHQGSEELRGLELGADAFICAPFSAGRLLELTELAAGIRKERTQIGTKDVLTYFVTDVMGQIDRLAFLKARGVDVNQSLHSLKEMCAVFQSLKGAALQTFLEVVLEAFEGASIKTFDIKHSYSGTSKRVRKREQEKIAAGLKAERPRLAGWLQTRSWGAAYSRSFSAQ